MMNEKMINEHISIQQISNLPIKITQTAKIK